MKKRAKIDLRPQREAIPAPSDAPSSAGRRGKKQIAGWFPPGTSTRLKHLATTLDKSVQDLLQEALEDLFAKYPKP